MSASLLYLLPERHVGLFVAYNSRGGNAAREKLLAAFLDRYHPDPRASPLPAAAGVSPGLARFSGTYVFNRRVRRGLEKIASQGNTVTIRSLAGALDLDGNRFVPEAPRLFLREDGKRRLAFKEDEQGRITRVFTEGAIARVYERRRWHESPGLHLAAAAFCLLAFLSVCLLSTRNLFRPRRPRPVAHRWAWRLATLVSVLDLGFLVGFVVLLARFGEELQYRVLPALIVPARGRAVGRRGDCRPSRVLCQRVAPPFLAPEPAPALHVGDARRSRLDRAARLLEPAGLPVLGRKHPDGLACAP